MPAKAPPPVAAYTLLHGEAAAIHILLQAPPCVSDKPRAMRQGARTISALPDWRHITSSQEKKRKAQHSMARSLVCLLACLLALVLVCLLASHLGSLGLFESA
jgi:hypothetical protein